MKKPKGGYVAVSEDPRPWWAFWRGRTATITCSEHGVIAAKVPAFISELGFDPVGSIAQLHLEGHRG